MISMMTESGYENALRHSCGEVAQEKKLENEILGSTQGCKISCSLRIM